jgi:hypothetical protein
MDKVEQAKLLQDICNSAPAAPDVSAPVDGDRTAFEAWARRKVSQPSFGGYHGEGGVFVYHHNIMQLMWQCWRAAQQELK